MTLTQAISPTTQEDVMRTIGFMGIAMLVMLLSFTGCGGAKRAEEAKNAHLADLQQQILDLREQVGRLQRRITAISAPVAPAPAPITAAEKLQAIDLEIKQLQGKIDKVKEVQADLAKSTNEDLARKDEISLREQELAKMKEDLAQLLKELAKISAPGPSP
jgi:predicted  nucleic acid-binding Zn-ribbon protein